MKVIDKKPIPTVPISLIEIRRQFIDRLWSGIFIIALIGAPVSALRSLSTGWLNMYTFHLLIAMFVAIIYIFRKKISYINKSILLVFIFLFIGIVGVFTYGILGAGLWWVIMSSFLVSTLYSLRAGAWVVGLSAAIIIIAGYCFTNEIITLPVDANVYLKTASTWVIILVVTTLMPFVVLQALAGYQQATLSLLNQLGQQKSQIQKMATHDQLTGLLLLKQTNDKLRAAIDQAKISGNKVALFCIDLDGFKAVNDNYGHDAGDNVMEEVAQRMLKYIQQKDTACRIGGDEFMLIFPEIIDLEELKNKAQKLVDEIAKPYKFLGKSIHISASIGISLFNDHAINAKLLRILADKAMYLVKESGKNGFAFVES